MGLGYDSVVACMHASWHLELTVLCSKQTTWAIYNYLAANSIIQSTKDCSLAACESYIQ